MRKQIICIMMVVAVMAACLVPACATGTTTTTETTDFGMTTEQLEAQQQYFTDVPKTHWAYSVIKTCVDGSMLQGYGNGKYGPNDQLKIDQVCQIVCNGVGYTPDADPNYWAYDAVYFCKNVLKCVPDFGAVNKTNYSVACSRELAVYILVKGLGLDKCTGTSSLTLADTPDGNTVTAAYKDAVEQALEKGVIKGMDASHKIAPKSILTRAQIAQMLVNIGCTKRPVSSTYNSTTYDDGGDIVYDPHAESGQCGDDSDLVPSGIQIPNAY